MITNEERKKVAAKLREKHCERQGTFEPQDMMMQAYNRLYDLLDCLNCLPKRRDLFLDLADLIEPEDRTCRWKHIEGTWFMSECGERYDCVIPDNFCPKCGAKVMW